VLDTGTLRWEGSEHQPTEHHRMTISAVRAVRAVRALRAAAALAAVLALAGCGSSTTTKTETVAPSSGTSATSATGASPATSTAPTSQSTTTSASASISSLPLCRAATLALTFLGQQGATGHGVIGFALRNTGTTSCHTFGFPGVLWLSKAGTPLPTNSIRTTRDFFGTAPLESLTVPPGGEVSFRLGVTHGAGGTAGCTTAAALQAIPPNDTSTLRVTIPNGVYECMTTTVTPVRPGKSAFQL
jgi:hypothetical protein